MFVTQAKTFCAMHWAWLDADTQDKLTDAYTSGQFADNRLKSEHWYRAVAEARMKLKEQDKYGE